MVSRLSSRGGAQGGGQQGQQGGQAGGGWQGGGGQQGGAQGNGWGGGQQQDQRQQVQEAIQPRESVRGAFSGGVGQQTETIQNGDYGETSQGGGAWGQGGAQGGQQGGGQGNGWGGSGGGQNGGQQASQGQRDDAPFDGGKAAAEPPKASRSRKKAADATPPAEAAPESGSAELLEITVRQQVLLAVLKASPEETLEDIMATTADLVHFVMTGSQDGAPTN